MSTPTAQLPILLPQTQVHAGIVLGLVATAVLWVVLARSPPGYQNETVEQNPIAARYAEISRERTISYQSSMLKFQHPKE